MTGEDIGPSGEPANAVLRNELVAKLPSKYVCPCVYISASLNLKQRNVFSSAKQLMHKTKSVNTLAQTEEGLVRQHPWLRSPWGTGSHLLRERRRLLVDFSMLWWNGPQSCAYRPH